MTLDGKPSVDRLKLIHAGRVLANDSESLETLGVKDGDHMVVMISPEKKPAPSPAAKASEPKKPEPSANAKQAEEEGKNGDAGSALLTGNAYEEAIAGFVQMGFDRSDAVAAMRAAFNNPDRAYQYLNQGLPEGASLSPDEGDSGEGQDEAAGDSEQEAASAINDQNPLGFLRQDPQFRQLRKAIQENPAMLPPLLQQIREINPQLYAAITEHREAFIEIMQEAEDGAQGAEPSDAGDGAYRIEVTADERQAIERLEQLGFDRAIVVEAFFACDKNEELAANYLFEHGNEDELGPSGKP